MKFDIKLFILFFFATILSCSVIAQDKEVVFYEVIKNDSVKLFFNDRYEFVEKACADFVRYSKIDENGAFNGAFLDTDRESTKLAEGNYVNGYKHGRFMFYYPNGQLKSRGLYRHNKPFGRWEHFMEDGKEDCTWEFRSDKVFLITKHNEDGDIIVSDGNGDFVGLGYRDFFSSRPMVVQGKIKNGERHGNWKIMFDKDKIYCEEEFDEGSFVKGILATAKAPNNMYLDRPEVNIFRPDYMVLLERYNFGKCSEAIKPSSKNTRAYTYNSQDVRTEIGSAITRRVESVNDLGMPTNGEYVMSIKFLIDEEGKPHNFNMVSPWGRNFYRSVRSVLQSKTYPPNSKELFFHVKIGFTGGTSYSFTYKFSRTNIGF